MITIKKVEIAEYSGFCFGVNRAMEMAESELNIASKNQNKIYSIGSLIHNEQALDRIKEKGLIISDNVEHFEKNSSAIIRSHGLSKSFYDRMEDINVNIIDATCPFVKKIQSIVHEGSEEGYKIIVIGDKNHPEVIGILGWAQGETYTINSIDDAYSFDSSNNSKYLVVVQTTFNVDRYQKIEYILKNKIANVVFHNTICYATKERQESAEKLSKKVDAMVVIGGKKSSNTLKLAEICRSNCKTFLIETAEDLDYDDIKDLEYIGIAAGASTPDFIIREVYDYIVNKIQFKELEFND